MTRGRALLNQDKVLKLPVLTLRLNREQHAGLQHDRASSPEHRLLLVEARAMLWPTKAAV
jgi:hypothetical protein